MSGKFKKKNAKVWKRGYRLGKKEKKPVHELTKTLNNDKKKTEINKKPIERIIYFFYCSINFISGLRASQGSGLLNKVVRGKGRK